MRLAGFFDRADSPGLAHQIAAAAFGLGSCRRLGELSADSDDPAPTITPWKDAPRAIVPVALRERGETATRGLATPITDRGRERDLLRRRQELNRVARETAASDLLACAATTATSTVPGCRLPRSPCCETSSAGRCRGSASAPTAVMQPSSESMRCATGQGRRHRRLLPRGQILNARTHRHHHPGG